MHDATTQVTESNPLPRAAEVRQPFYTRVKLHPPQKLTRAHLAVGSRPGVTSAMAAAAQRIATRIGGQLKCELKCSATLLPTTLHPFSHLAARSLFVTLELGDALVVVELDALGVGAVLSQITGSNEPAGLPSRLSNIEEAALSWVVLSTLAELRGESAFAGITPRLLGLTLERGDVLNQLDARRRHVGVQVQLELGKVRSVARVLVPAQWLQSKFDSMPAETPALDARIGAATLAASCFLGSAQLAPNEARNLNVGDVVVFAGVSYGAQGLTGPGRLVTSTFELSGTFASSGFTLTRALGRTTQEITMSSLTDPTVPVEIEIELTRVRVPLHQLGGLRQGTVIPLHINAAQHVVLRIGDKTIGKAELVEVEGEIGARLVELW
ncbi:MAG: FliM/FliN family flagellar motor switch protein [Myxococcaceae bacterium]